MKSNLATTILLGVLAISAFTSAVLCWQYIAKSRQLRTLQVQVNFINTRRAAITSLANDTLKYSERNPAIDPVLIASGIKGNRAGTNAPRPTPGK